MMKYNSPKKQKSTQHSQEGGFTLMETLVAIFILLISTTGPLAFAQGGLRASFLARDQVVAFYLAQDVTETIKNLRDNAALNNQDWLHYLGACAPSQATPTRVCNMSTSNPPRIVSCPTNGACPVMKYNTTNQTYLDHDHSSAGANIVDSKYTRTVHTRLLNPNELQIIVEVSWNTLHFTKREIVIQENIYNWIPEYEVVVP